MSSPSEKQNRKLNHPVLGAFGFGVKNLPNGASYARQYRKELRQVTSRVKVSEGEGADAGHEGKKGPEWKSGREWELIRDQRRAFLRMLQGKNRLVRNFKDLENRSGDEEFADKLLDNVSDYMAPFLVSDQVKDPELRRALAKEQMPSLSEEANDFMTWVKDTHMPSGEVDALEVSNEVIITSDPAELILIANDHKITKEDEPGLTPDEKRKKVKIRFEALRKAYLMLLVAQVRKFKSGHLGDLKFFSQLMSKYMYSPDKGFGEHKTRYLVSEHLVLENEEKEGVANQMNHKCVGFKLFDSKERANLGLNDNSSHVSRPMLGANGEAKDLGAMRMKKILTPIEMRSFDVGKGEERQTVEFRVHNRFKSNRSCIVKMLRKDMQLSENPEADVSDLNGVRFVMESAEQVQWFMAKFEREVSKDHEFVLIEQDTSVGKAGALKCIKNVVSIDGKRFELQFFTFPEYADYEYSQPDSRDMYEIMRFIESSCSEAIYPTEIYGDIDRKEYEKMAKRKILAERKFMVGGMHEFQPTAEA